MAKIDIDFIKKWVNISEEELMVRLVRDAIALQAEAEANEKAAVIREREADEEYDIGFVKDFFNGYKYFSQYFTDEQILAACKHNMSKYDLASEELFRGHLEKAPFGRIVRHQNGEFTEYSRNGWERKVRDIGTVILVPNHYQGVSGGSEVAKELMTKKCPYVKDYSVYVYEITGYGNDWVFVKTPEAISTGNSTTSLYVPLSALFTHNADKIVETHRKYWSDYGGGKYNTDTEAFLASDFVHDFLKKVKGGI